MQKHPALRWLKQLIIELIDSRLQNGAAALTFYAMLSVFPAAIFGLSLLPYLPIPNLQSAIFELLAQVLPANAAELFSDTVQRILSQRHTGLLSFGLVFAIWSATSGLVAVMEQLDVVHRTRHPRSPLRARGRALLLLFPIFASIVVTFGLVIFGGALQSLLQARLGTGPFLLRCFAGFRWVVITFALLTGTAATYRFGPTQSRPFRLFSLGAMFASLGQMLASIAFKFYVAHFANYDAVYGSLGAVIVLLLWIFVSGWVFLVGAEIDEFCSNNELSRARTASPGAKDARAM